MSANLRDKWFAANREVTSANLLVNFTSDEKSQGVIRQIDELNQAGGEAEFPFGVYEMDIDC